MNSTLPSTDLRPLERIREFGFVLAKIAVIIGLYSLQRITCRLLKHDAAQDRGREWQTCGVIVPAARNGPLLVTV